MFRVVIPARYGSTRLPGKALIPLAGKPMVQWVYERARASGAAEVLVATDDDRIAAAARGFGATVVMTAAEHVSGTDRIAEVARSCGWSERDIVVNVQGDEPLVPSAAIDQVARVLEATPAADLGTLTAPLRSDQDYWDPNVVKVVAAASGRALFFSRAPIPWHRDAARSGPHDLPAPPAVAQRHIGMYAYRVGALRRIAALPEAPLEGIERLEQLRALTHGLHIQLAPACEIPLGDVNTHEDIATAERLLQAR
jgi:3-deoxy-manno-octulosonate cytidylyltransferase (CMP-KDO synthetase)